MIFRAEYHILNLCSSSSKITDVNHVVEEMAAQHREILEALIDERWGDAKKALVRHIRDQQPIVQQLMEEIQSGATDVKSDQASA